MILQLGAADRQKAAVKRRDIWRLAIASILLGASASAAAAGTMCRHENYEPHCVSLEQLGIVGPMHKFRFVNICDARFKNLDVFTCPQHGECRIEERDIRPCGVTPSPPSWRINAVLRWENVRPDGATYNAGPSWHPSKGNGQ
jgi:hypothetical protein